MHTARAERHLSGGRRRGESLTDRVELFKLHAKEHAGSKCEASKRDKERDKEVTNVDKRTLESFVDQRQPVLRTQILEASQEANDNIQCRENDVSIAEMHRVV